jgi:hypothetical protein
VRDDTNDAKAGLVKVRYKTTSFEAGVGAIYDRIAPAGTMIRPALANKPIDEYIANAYVALVTEGPTVIGEGFAFRHQSDGDSWMTYAAYGLVGFHVREWCMPYAAVDLVRGAGEDPYFTPDPAMTSYADLVEAIVGVRFDTSTWSAVKVEVRLLHVDGVDDDQYTAAANWSFGL